MAYLEISKDLPIDVKVGQMLKFDYEGSQVYLQIMRKQAGKVWAKRLDPDLIMTPEQADQQVIVVPKN